MEVGDGWLLLATPVGGEALVPFAAVTGVAGLPRGSGRRPIAGAGSGWATRCAD